MREIERPASAHERFGKLMQATLVAAGIGCGAAGCEKEPPRIAKWNLSTITELSRDSLGQEAAGQLTEGKAGIIYRFTGYYARGKKQCFADIFIPAGTTSSAAERYHEARMQITPVGEEIFGPNSVTDAPHIIGCEKQAPDLLKLFKDPTFIRLP